MRLKALDFGLEVFHEAGFALWRTGLFAEGVPVRNPGMFRSDRPGAAGKDPKASTVVRERDRF